MKPRIRTAFTLPWLPLALALSLSATTLGADRNTSSADFAGSTGDLVGQLTDTRGHVAFVGNAAVFLCDATTGMPIHRQTKRSIEPSLSDPRIDKPWYTETNDQGYFEFKAVAVGKYRLVAQSWSGTKGFPGFSVQLKPSAFVTLHGTAENVEVKSGEKTTAYPRQLGNHTLRIFNDPEEAHALLLISLKPTLGDGILGPYGWGRDFLRHLIGVTQMEVPYVTISGLPETAAVHVGLMNYDNNPGVAAGSYAPGQREGKLRIIASWSNGHKDPPPELVALTDHLEGKKIDIRLFLTKIDPSKAGGVQARRELYELLAKDNQTTVEVDGMGQVRLADLLAAYSYIELRKKK